MRNAAALLVFGVTAVLVFKGTVLLRDRVDLVREARRTGREAAERDIAGGVPRIRRPLDGFGSLPPDGIGIGRASGLPLEDCGYWCGTCAAGHEDAEDEAYNERILDSLERGGLDGFRLGHKLRTKAQLASLFAAGRAVRLGTDGATVGVEGGAVEVTYRRRRWDDGSESHWIEVTTAGGEPRRLRLFYPPDWPDRPGTMLFASPHGPFDALVADDGTTLVLRDVEGYGWIVDLPSATVVQVSGPI